MERRVSVRYRASSRSTSRKKQLPVEMSMWFHGSRRHRSFPDELAIRIRRLRRASHVKRSHLILQKCWLDGACQVIAAPIICCFSSAFYRRRHRGASENTIDPMMILRRKRGFELKLAEERKPREARAPSARQSRVRDQGSELSQRRVFRLHSRFSPYLLQLPTITS